MQKARLEVLEDCDFESRDLYLLFTFLRFQTYQDSGTEKSDNCVKNSSSSKKLLNETYTEGVKQLVLKKSVRVNVAK